MYNIYISVICYKKNKYILSEARVLVNDDIIIQNINYTPQTSSDPDEKGT